MKKIIAFVVATMFSASMAIASPEEDEALLQNFSNMGQTTAILQACGYDEKADAFHAMVMEQIISLISSHQELVPEISNNYDRGMAKFKSTSAGQGPPPAEICAELLSVVSEYGL